MLNLEALFKLLCEEWGKSYLLMIEVDCDSRVRIGELKVKS
jgi:hypothetical protein